MVVCEVRGHEPLLPARLRVGDEAAARLDRLTASVYHADQHPQTKHLAIPFDQRHPTGCPDFYAKKLWYIVSGHNEKGSKALTELQ